MCHAHAIITPWSVRFSAYNDTYMGYNWKLLGSSSVETTQIKLLYALDYLNYMIGTLCGFTPGLVTCCLYVRVYHYLLYLNDGQD